MTSYIHPSCFSVILSSCNIEMSSLFWGNTIKLTVMSHWLVIEPLVTVIHICSDLNAFLFWWNQHWMYNVGYALSPGPLLVCVSLCVLACVFVRVISWSRRAWAGWVEVVAPALPPETCLCCRGNEMRPLLIPAPATHLIISTGLH